MIQQNITPSVKSQQPGQENIHRPWLVVRLLSADKPYIVACFANRQDAEDHLRFLRRFIPQAAFQMMFEAPEPDAGTVGRCTRTFQYRKIER
jgi:hypothetical protein